MDDIVERLRGHEELGTDLEDAAANAISGLRQNRDLANAEIERLTAEVKSAFVGGWLAMCEVIERGSNGRTKFNGMDEILLAESLFEDWKNRDSGSPKRCSYCDHYAVTGSWECEMCGRTGKDLPVTADSKHDPCPHCGCRPFQTNLIIHEAGCPNITPAEKGQKSHPPRKKRAPQ